MSDFTVWVGGLPRGVQQIELEEFFIQYGRLSDVQIRSSTKDVFAFVVFENAEEGLEAIKELNDTKFLDTNQSVRLEKSNRKPPGGANGGKGSGGPRHDRSSSRRCRSRSHSRSLSRRRDDSQDRAQEGPLTAWLGGLPKGVKEEEIIEFCKGFGKITSIRIRSSERDVFAFADFTDGELGKQACKELDQRKWHLDDTKVIQVRESATKRPRRDVERNRRTPSPFRHKGVLDGKYRVDLRQLPPNMPWFELKDIARDFGDSVVFANVFIKSGLSCGVIEYTERDHANRLVKEMNGRKIEGHKDRVEVSKSGWE